MNKQVEHKPTKSYWLKGSSVTFEHGSRLFDCDEHFKLHGCENCPKRGRISVCHFYFNTPKSMSDVEILHDLKTEP